MKLIIAEKPSVAMEIANIVGCKQKKAGYMLGEDFIVTWCVGHLVSLANPEAYSAKYKYWNKEDLPIIPINWKFDLNPYTKKQFKVVEGLLNSDMITSVICATDAGREGELIFRLVYNYAKCKKPIERLWISSMEDTAIREGLENLRKGEEYLNLYQSALARAKADWIVGLNLTRLYTVSYGEKLTIGRVQTPTLAIIVNRDKSIEDFNKEKYYILNLECVHVEKIYPISFSSGRLESEKIAKEIIGICPKKLIVKDVKEEETKTKPPLLYDLTELQKEANVLYSFSAQQTLDLAQSLYEKKLITYPRTDSKYVTEDMKETIEKLIKENKYFELNQIYTNKIFNNKKVSDHHGLLPTLSSKENSLNLPDSEQKIYDLIYYRLLESLYKENINYISTIISSIYFGNEEIMLKSSGKLIQEEGFKSIQKLYKKVDLEEKIVPSYTIGDEIEVTEVKILEKYTQPPKTFTESSLLAAMEKAGKDDLDKSLETEKEGLGTPATRASIIEKLIDVGYIKREKKSILSTDKGKKLISVIQDDFITSSSTTSFWENKLSKISNGTFSEEKFLNELIEQIKNSCISFKIDSKAFPPVGKCPICGAEVHKASKVYKCKSCDFILFKSILKKELKEQEVKELLEGKETNMISGFISKSGKKFNAKLYLKEGKIQFKFS